MKMYAQTLICEANGCSRTFERTNRKPPKRYCSDGCRARAGDERRIERLRQRLIDGTLSEADLSTLAVILSNVDHKLAARARKGSARPLKITASHRKILVFIEANGNATAPEVVEIMPSAPVRLRELRKLGYLSSERRGRYTVFDLTTTGQDLADKIIGDEIASEAGG